MDFPFNLIFVVGELAHIENPDEGLGSLDDGQGQPDVPVDLPIKSSIIVGENAVAYHHEVSVVLPFDLPRAKLALGRSLHARGLDQVHSASDVLVGELALFDILEGVGDGFALKDGGVRVLVIPTSSVTPVFHPTPHRVHSRSHVSQNVVT